MRAGDSPKNIMKRMLENYSTNTKMLKEIDSRLKSISELLQGEIRSTSLVKVNENRIYKNNLAKIITEESELGEEKKYYQFEISSVNSFLKKLDTLNRRILTDKYLLKKSNSEMEKIYSYSSSSLHKRIDSTIYKYSKRV